MNSKQIRNFCIIAHIDHGKSTLADRLLEATKTIAAKDMKEQILDNMDLERERGITIKAHAIRMSYTAKDGQIYELHLIDTPGHVDFTYEVSRSLAACEGAVLVVDCTQGVEAQTISNLLLAMENNLMIIPVINKIDLQGAQVEETKKQIIDLIGCNADEIIPASAKMGIGISEILEAVVARIPAPSGDPNKPLKALIFDSSYDSYRGAVPYIRVVDGVIRAGMKILFFATNSVYEVNEVGFMRLQRFPVPQLEPGEVGYVVGSFKTLSDTKVGDTITDFNNPATEPLPGYREVKPMVFSGIFPVSSDQYEDLKVSLEKLKLSDSSLIYLPETSAALGFGFRCGFLGLLHLEIVQERISREHGIEIISTVPNVEYQVIKRDGSMVEVDNPSELPPSGQVEFIKEPFISAQIFVPSDYIGPIMKLCQDRRGIYKKMEYLDQTRVDIHYDIPLAEVVFDFYDRLKSLSRGYASFDYEFLDYRQSDLVKLDIMINSSPVDALSSITHRDHAYEWGRDLCEKLRKIIPRQMFEVVIQAAIGSRIISRESIKPLRKNVTAKCYGGDITRKRKLLERQKEGKKRMKQVGNVEIPQEAFMSVLHVERT